MVANYTEATALPHKMIEKEATQEHRCPFPDCKFLFKGKRWIPSERVNHFAHHICLNHVREDEEIFVADVRDQPACGWCGSRKGKCKTVKVLQKYQARCTSSLGKVSRKLPFMPKALNTLDKCPMVGCKEIVWSHNLKKHWIAAHDQVANEMANQIFDKVEKFTKSAAAMLLKLQTSIGLTRVY